MQLTTEVEFDEPVIQLSVHKVSQVIDLHRSDGETIACTPQHPFYVHGKGFEEAGSLAEGDRLTYDDESTTTSYAVLAAVTVSEITAEPTTNTAATATLVYNFEVQDTHTYFVGTERGGLWVHNNGGCASILESIYAHPEQMEGMTKDDVRSVIGDVEQPWEEGAMGDSKSQPGGGWVVRERNTSGRDFTGRYLQYHPGTPRHYGGAPYWKVSVGGLTRVWRGLAGK